MHVTDGLLVRVSAWLLVSVVHMPTGSGYIPAACNS